MRKVIFFVSIVLLLIGLVFPVSVLARTGPQSNFPVPTIYRTSVHYDVLSGENVSVHIYSKCYDSNPPSGPWFVEFVVQYDNEDGTQYPIQTDITGIPSGSSTRSQIGSVTGGNLGANQLNLLHLEPGSSVSYSSINIEVTVNGTLAVDPVNLTNLSASCGPSNVSLASTSTSVANQGWLLVLPFVALVLFTAVFLRRRVQA